MEHISVVPRGSVNRRNLKLFLKSISHGLKRLPNQDVPKMGIKLDTADIAPISHNAVEQGKHLQECPRNSERRYENIIVKTLMSKKFSKKI